MLRRAVAVLGIVFSKLRLEPAPLLIGFVLGPLMVENLRRAMQMSRGDAGVFLREPISAAMLVLAALALLAMAAPALRRRKDEAVAE